MASYHDPAGHVTFTRILLQVRILSSTPRWIIIVSALLMACAIGFAIKTGYPLRYDDERQYLDVATSVVHGKGFALDGALSARRPPAWPLLLAPFVAIGAPTHLLLAIPALLICVAAVLAGWVAVRITGSRWGAIATPLVIVYPLNLYTGSTLYPQALATAAMFLLWLLCSYFSDQPRQQPLWVAAIAGLTASCLALAVPTMIVAALLIIVWLLRGQGGLRALVCGAVMVTPVLGWAARNWVALGSPVLFSTTFGENLLIGNNDTATGDSGVDVDLFAVNRGTGNLDSVALDNHYRQAALEWIRDHPGDAFVLYLEKIANYFSPYNAPVTPGQTSGYHVLIAYATFGGLMIAVIARIMLRRYYPMVRSEWLFIGLFVLNAPVMAVFFTRTRFRQPLDATLVVEAAIGLLAVIALLAQMRRTSRRGPLPDNGPARGPGNGVVGSTPKRDQTPTEESDSAVAAGETD